MSKIKRFFAIALSSVVVCCSAAVVLMHVSSVHATGESAVILRKAMMQNIRYCYDHANVFKNSVKEQDYVKDGVEALMGASGKSDNLVYLPNQIDNTITDAGLSCYQVLTGFSRGNQRVSSIFSIFGKSVPTSIADFGYSVPENSTDDSRQGCIYFKYQYPNKETHQLSSGRTDELCFKIKSDGYLEESVGSNGKNIINNGGATADGAVVLKRNANDGSIQLRVTDPILTSISPVEFNPKGKWDDVGNVFVPSVVRLFNETLSSDIYGYGKMSAATDAILSVTDGNVYKEATLDKSNGASVLMNYLNNGQGFTGYTLNDENKYYLYTAYLNDALNQPGSTLTYSNCGTSKQAAMDATDGHHAVRSGSQWCSLTGVEGVRKYNGQQMSTNGHFRLMPTDFAVIMDALRDLDYDKLEEQGVNIGTITGNGSIENPVGPSNPDSDSTTTPGDTSTTALCYDGAGALGWIACPVLGAVGNAAQYMYDEYVDPALQIKASELMQPGGGVYSGWSNFRNIANILFAIGFAVIILAQVTGIGLSNYNIKKILPRLIMVAVLVNVSFIICQLAVDLSNLLGVGLRNMFSLMKINGEPASVDVGDILGSVGIFALGTGAVVTFVGLSVGLATLRFWIFPLLVSVLGCLIGILFFFIILGVRQAGIVILVALAPVAIVCYALPNTKSFFDRWKKLFTALLLVYPICGLLMGGGQYAGALLLSIRDGAGESMGFFYTITAMLINVLPFFFIPSLLKGSMALMGNLGAKISAFGSNLGRGVTRGARGTRFYQEHQAEEQRRLELKRNQTRVGRYSNDKGGGLVGAARRRLGMNRSLSGRAATRAALAQSGIDSTTSTTANAIRLRWESDGTASNIEAKLNEDGSIAEGDSSLESIYYNATRRLMERPTDNDALEQQKAASMLLAASKPGRESLRQANNRLAQYVNSLSGDEKKQLTAQQVMQRTANNILRTNAGDISKSPILDEQLTGMQGYKPNEYGGLETSSLQKSIAKLSTRTMSAMGSKDLEAYVRAVQNGQIAAGSDYFNTLTSMASKTLIDPHYKGQIGADTLQQIRQLANMRYTQAVTQEDDAERIARNTRAIRNVSSADSSELARIQEGLRDRSITGESRQQLLEALENTMLTGAAADDPSSIGLTSDRASQIHKILRDNGVDMVAKAQSGEYSGGGSGVSIGAMSPAQFAQRYEALMGFKVDHEPRQRTITTSAADTPLGPTRIVESTQPDGAGRVDVYSPGGTRIGGGRVTPGGIIVDESTQSRPRPTGQNGSSR